MGTIEHERATCIADSLVDNGRYLKMYCKGFHGNYCEDDNRLFPGRFAENLLD